MESSECQHCVQTQDESLPLSQLKCDRIVTEM